MLPLPVFTFKIQMHCTYSHRKCRTFDLKMPYFRIANAVLSHRKCHTFAFNGKDLRDKGTIK